MSDQNYDPYSDQALLGAVYDSGVFIEVSAAASVNAADQAAKRQAMIPTDRPNPFKPVRPPAAVVVAAPKVRPSLSADVDAILAEEGIFQPRDDEWDEAA